MIASTPRSRIDMLLHSRGMAPSRSRARDMVLRGCVAVNGCPVTKPGALFAADCQIEVEDAAQSYVSRAALKLVAGLDVSGLSVASAHCVDLGASTGGFTQVLLERGAKHVVAVDVGHGQMDAQIAADARVTLREGLNAREIVASDLLQPPDLVVSDMSFISLRIAAEPTLLLCAFPAHAILLVKPQFEVGRQAVGSNGIVRDEGAIDAMLEDIRTWFDGLPGWSHTALIPSPIKGGDGNREFLLLGKRA